VKEIQGNALGVQKLLLHDDSILPCEGIFIAVGTIPSTTLLDALGVEKDPDGTIRVDHRQETNIHGLYAA
jgi:thioredoxin reductase